MYFNKLTNLLSPPDDIDSNSIERNVELAEEHFKIIFPDDYIKETLINTLTNIPNYHHQPIEG